MRSPPMPPPVGLPLAASVPLLDCASVGVVLVLGVLLDSSSGSARQTVGERRWWWCRCCCLFWRARGSGAAARAAAHAALRLLPRLAHRAGPLQRPSAKLIVCLDG
jgi:hypothetical protein